MKKLMKLVAGVACALMAGTVVAADPHNIQADVCSELNYSVELDPDYPGGATLYAHFCLSNSLVSLPDPITPPTRTSNYVFDGYWDKQGGRGDQYIDKDGNWQMPIPLDLKKLYAKWVAQKVRVWGGLAGPDTYVDIVTGVVWHAAMPMLPLSLMEIAESRMDMHFAGAFDEPQTSLVSESRGNQYYKRNGTSARNWNDMRFDDAAYSVANPPTLYMHWVSERARVDILSVTTRAPWSGEVDIVYEGVDIPVANGRAYRLDLQYRLSPTNAWTEVPPEHYRRLSDWTELCEHNGVTQLVHRVTIGTDRLTWDARLTLGSPLNRPDAQVRINACDIGARWDGYYPDQPQPGVWPANLMCLDFGSADGILTQPQDPAHLGSPLAPVDLAQLAELAKRELELFRTQRILFRQIPAGYFKDGDRYWHFSGTTYASVFRLTKGQLARLKGVTTSEKDDPTVASVSLSTLRGLDHSPNEPPEGLLGMLNARIGGNWKIDVMPDYQYGRRLLWAGRGVCPVMDEVSAAEYGDFGGSYAVGGKKPSDWGFFDLISGYELTLSTRNNLHFAKFGAGSAASAPTDVGPDVRCDCTEDQTLAVRLFLTPMQNNTVLVEEISEEELKPLDARIYGDPAWVWLDTCVEREIVGPTWIPYSGTHWGEVKGASAVISATLESDGMTEYVAYPGYQGYDGTDEGEVLWYPLCEGRYTLAHYVGQQVETCVCNVLMGRADVAYEPLPLPWSKYLKANIQLEGLGTNGNYTLEFQYRLANDAWTSISPSSLLNLPPVVSNANLTAAWHAPDQLGDTFVGDIEMRSILRKCPIADGGIGAMQIYPQKAVVLNLETGRVTYDTVQDFNELWDRYLKDGKPATTNMVFVKVPAGSYFGRDGMLRIFDRDYYIAAAPVTPQQFEAVGGVFPAQGLIYPVAESFAANIEKKFDCLGFEFTVPTEDEWERAVKGGLIHVDREHWEWCSDFFDGSTTDRVLRRSAIERKGSRTDRADASFRVRPILRLPGDPKLEYWSITGEVGRVSLDFTNRLSIANGETVALPLDGWGLAPTATRTELTVSGGSAEPFNAVVTNFDASVTGQVIRVREDGSYGLTACFDDGLTLTGEVFVQIPADELLRERLQPEGTVELRNGFVYAYLTSDLVRSVEIPPLMGQVTLDLCGHVLTGAGGEPALKVREGTQLTVVDSDPERRGNVTAGEGASCPFELSSTDGLTMTQLPYAASSLDGAGVTRAVYDGQTHALRFVTAADEMVEFTGANEFVNAGTNRVTFTYRREGFEPLVAFATLEIAPWRFNTTEFVGAAVDDQPWSETPFCPVPVISNLTLRTMLTVSNDFTCTLRADANGAAYVLATGCGNYCGTLVCALIKKDSPDIGDLYLGDVPVVVAGYSGTADGESHAVTYRWTSSDVYNNTILFSTDGKNWSSMPPSFVTTYGREIRVYYFAQSFYASKHTKAYNSTRWYVTVQISENSPGGPDDPDDPVDPAPTPVFGPSEGGRLFADNGDGTVGITIGNAKAGVTYAVTAAKDLTFDGATTTEATAAKDGPLTVNVPIPSAETGFFKASVRQ